MPNSKNIDAIWKDILSWQTEINAKDELLMRRKPVHDQALPPVQKSTEIFVDKMKPIGVDALLAKETLPTVSPNKDKKPQTRTEKAEAEKAKGNAYFVKKDYTNAILYYGKAIDLDPTAPVYFVNRAMAYLKSNKYLEAEKDCTRGLQLQPTNVKALWRRGISLKELGRINEARKDFELGLTIEPNNKSLLEELNRLPPLKVVGKNPLNNSQKKKEQLLEQMRRLPIKVVDEAYSMPKERAKTRKAQETKTTEKVESKPAIVEPSPTGAAKKTIKTKPIVSDINPMTVPEISKPDISLAKPPLKLTSPRTNYEFERDWKTYKCRGDDVLYQYFKCIPPSAYATIFKSSLESDQFEKMIDLLHLNENSHQNIYHILEGLSQVKRIDMLVMFLGKKQQQALQELFGLLKQSSDGIPKEKLSSLAKIYNTRI